jgi:hypothetical protein
MHVERVSDAYRWQQKETASAVSSEPNGYGACGNPGANATVVTVARNDLESGQYSYALYTITVVLP